MYCCVNEYAALAQKPGKFLGGSRCGVPSFRRIFPISRGGLWGLAIATHFDEFHPATLCSGYHSILVRTRYHTAPPDSAVHRGGIKGGIKTLRAGPSKSQHSTGACEVVVNAMLPAVVPTGPEM